MNAARISSCPMTGIQLRTMELPRGPAATRVEVAELREDQGVETGTHARHLPCTPAFSKTFMRKSEVST